MPPAGRMLTGRGPFVDGFNVTETEIPQLGGGCEGSLAAAKIYPAGSHAPGCPASPLMPDENEKPPQEEQKQEPRGTKKKNSSGGWSTRVCNASGCSTVPSYGAPGTKRQFCRQHAKPGMINVASKKCGMLDQSAGGRPCGKVATYGVLGGKRERCAAHAGVNMVDIFNRKCIIVGCHLRATFGEEGGRRERCARHTKSGMISFNRKRCVVRGCLELASHAEDGGTGPREVCARHAEGATDDSVRTDEPLVRRKRGRPRKNPIVAPAAGHAGGNGSSASTGEAGKGAQSGRRVAAAGAAIDTRVRRARQSDDSARRSPPLSGDKDGTRSLRLLHVTEAGWASVDWDWGAAFESAQQSMRP